MGITVENDTHLEALASYLDQDNSGSITFDEFYAWWAGHVKKADWSQLERQLELLAAAHDLFRRYDTDRSGALSIQEFSEMYK